MAGKLVHFEIPADDTAEAREFWGSLFGWKFEAYPGPSEYHMTQITDQAGAAISTRTARAAAVIVVFNVAPPMKVIVRCRP